MAKGGLVLSKKVTEAFEYARGFHSEFRKGTKIPYMAHLMGVAAMVMAEAGGKVPVTEEMVMAALLHDVVEDHGGRPRLLEVEARFGKKVARMVEGLTDSFADAKAEKERWEDRKKRYLARFKTEPLQVLLISLADKLYNAKSILMDYREHGDAIWKRFNRGADKQLWYFKSLLRIFKARLDARMVSEFAAVVKELEGLVKAQSSQ